MNGGGAEVGYIAMTFAGFLSSNIHLFSGFIIKFD
jgi:hypothetical protein